MANQRTIFRWLAVNLQLGAADFSESDQRLLDQAAAIDEMRAVAAELGKPQGEWPTVREFDKHAGPGWTSDRVRELFGRWRTVIRELNGGSRHATAEQRAYRRQIAGRDYAYEDPWACIKQWLETKPPVKDRDTYNAWARLQNQGRRGGSGYKPGSTSIIQRLGLPWREIIRVANGEIDRSQATRSSGLEKPTWSTVDGHALVGRRDIAQLLGIDYQRVRRLESEVRFPRPVLVLRNTPAWLRDDIVGYQAGSEAPTRERDEFHSLYLTAAELAARHGVTPAALRQKEARAPAPDGAICGKHIWYLPHVEKWEAENPPTPHSGRMRLLNASE